MDDEHVLTLAGVLRELGATLDEREDVPAALESVRESDGKSRIEGGEMERFERYGDWRRL